MHRWHESGCRRPDVSAASGLPCCAYCFAIPSLEDHPVPRQPLPQLQDRRRMSLKWPAAVTYSDWESEKDSRVFQNDNLNDTLGFETPKSLLPELPSEDSIRLLRLRPGRHNDPIHADVEIVRINQIPLPLYEAISYTAVNDLADPAKSSPVFIGSYWDTAYVPINCGKALRRFRRQNGDRLLWVDSLCINHTSPDEKNIQVHILREIYSRATKVLAYVGDEHSDFGPAFSLLREITAFQPTPGDHPALDENSRSSLSTLLKQPYFSRRWVLQEILMARELEIGCDGDSARWPTRWPKLPFGGTYPDLDVPPWLFRGSKWYPFTGTDLLNVLVDASPYQCSDPRDKVFAILGLMGEKFISPDYRLPTESVYIGIAAYFIKSWHTMDVIALLGQKNRTFDLPSWVPDWSQNLSLPSLDTFLRSEIRTDPEDFVMDGAIRIMFEGLGSVHCEIEVSSATGAMRLQGFKLCKVLGERSQFPRYTHIQMPPVPKGCGIISIPHQNYEIHGSDSLFLLNGYNYPVILRERPGQGVYTLVSACVLSISSPFRNLMVLGSRRRRRMKPSSQLRVSALTLEDQNNIQQFYSRLERVPPGSDGSPSPETVRARVLSFLMLSYTAIERIEKSLREDWNNWNQELGWMFRDQSAIWQFLLEINQLNLDQRTGEDRIDLKLPGYLSAAHSGTGFPSTYTWDLSQFCWSFLQPTDTTQSAPELQWSPMVDQLRSHIPEIQKWAQVTEQILRLFEYTATSLGEAWGSFPGTQLPRKWSNNYEKFLAVYGTTIQQGKERQKRPHLEPDYLWSPSGFESQLRVREEIWALRTPDERYFSDTNMEVHALLNIMGVDLYSEQTIDIV